jgi:predicted nucleic acid-binding protein
VTAGAADRYTLDTSAIVAFFANEPGADRVEGVLVLAEKRRAEVNVSFMTYMELTYQLWRRGGEKAGKLAYLRLKALDLKRVDVSEGLTLRAARIKASFELSVADAWIAATALITEGHLVHKDPEFRPLTGLLSLVELPLKPSRRPGL